MPSPLEEKDSDSEEEGLGISIAPSSSPSGNMDLESGVARNLAVENPPIILSTSTQSGSVSASVHHDRALDRERSAVPPPGPEIVDDNVEPSFLPGPVPASVAPPSGPEIVDDGVEPSFLPEVAPALAGPPPGPEMIDDSVEPSLLPVPLPGSEAVDLECGEKKPTHALMPSGVEMIDEEASPPLFDEQDSKRPSVGGEVDDDTGPIPYHHNEEEYSKMLAESQGKRQAEADTGIEAMADQSPSILGVDEEAPRGEESHGPIAPSHDIDEEVQQGQEQTQFNSNVVPLQDGTVLDPTSANVQQEGEEEDGQGEFDYIIPEAYIPDVSREVIDVVAEPLLPWWRQRRTIVLFGVICLVAIAAAIAVGVSFSQDRTETEVLSVVLTSSPSSSFMPSSEPTTPQPTMNPTSLPSASQVPSLSPTACVNHITESRQKLELPLNDPVWPSIRMDGKNAVFLAREEGTTSIYVTFYTLTDDNGWARTGFFVEPYDEFNKDVVYDYYLDVSEGTAFVGFPQKSTDDGAGAGIIYIYVQMSDGLWEKTAGPLLPEDGGNAGAYFGHRFGIDGRLAVVGALNDKLLYVFKKTSMGWQQHLKFSVDYDLSHCILVGDTILGLDIYSAEIYLYRYDQDKNSIVTLQDTIEGNPEGKLFEGFEYQLILTGTSRMIANVRLSEEYLVYTSQLFKMNYDTQMPESGMEGVYIYQRQVINATYAFQQFLNSSDYEDKFGWELAFENDILVIGGGNHTYVFSQQPDGYFEESFKFEETYDIFKMSCRNAIAMTLGKELHSMSLQFCTQQMPTGMPSLSLAPTNVPSASISPSTKLPTSSVPSSSLKPSSSPSFSLAPSSSGAPSILPSSSLAPTICYDIKVVIMTTGANTEGFEDGVTSWQLYQKETEKIILQGGPFKKDKIDEYVAECVEPNNYMFNISNSDGNGFGECSDCGYFVWVDDTVVGGRTSFHDNDRMHFPAPPRTQEPNPNLPSYNGVPMCGMDFFVNILVDENPQEITWDVVNEKGEIVVSGGPYQKIHAQYGEWSCLQGDGNYVFTIYDSGGDPSVAKTATYFIGIHGNTILKKADLDFGASESTPFTIGGTSLSKNTNPPTKSPAKSNPFEFWPS